MTLLGRIPFLSVFVFYWMPTEPSAYNNFLHTKNEYLAFVLVVNTTIFHYDTKNDR